MVIHVCPNKGTSNAIKIDLTDDKMRLFSAVCQLPGAVKLNKKDPAEATITIAIEVVQRLGKGKGKRIADDKDDKDDKSTPGKRKDGSIRGSKLPSLFNM
ncbi:hypothetical protein IAT38_003265 [Cryptococcus sp. DSM 104549]